MTRTWRAILLVLALFAVAACGGGDDDGGGSAGGGGELEGESVEVAAVWTGTEQKRFQAVLDAFEEETGAKVTYTSTGDDISAALGPRISGGDPPDVAILPQPGLLQDFAERGVLQEIEDIAGDEIDENYDPVWRQLGSVDDKLYGVWFKAANKSLVWYNTKVFEDAGVEEPTNLDEFLETAQTISDFGVPALSVGGADGWTLTDWFENVYLRTAGPDMYDKLSRHEIPWTDPSVKQALETLGRIFQSNLMAGGTQGAVQTDFPTSVSQVFVDPAKAAMVYEGDFVANVIEGDTEAKVGEEAEVFDFPEIGDSGTAVVGGGDVAVLMKDSKAGRRLIEWLATPDAAEPWAEQGGFISPNKALDTDVYPDDIIRGIAESLVGAGEKFRFDMSDLQPTQFGGTPGRGLFKILQDFLANPSAIDQITQQLEADAAAAFSQG